MEKKKILSGKLGGTDTQRVTKCLTGDFYAYDSDKSALSGQLIASTT